VLILTFQKRLLFCQMCKYLPPQLKIYCFVKKNIFHEQYHVHLIPLGRNWHLWECKFFFEKEKNITSFSDKNLNFLILHLFPVNFWQQAFLLFKNTVAIQVYTQRGKYLNIGNLQRIVWGKYLHIGNLQRIVRGKYLHIGKLKG